MPGLLVHDGINEENPRDLQLYVFGEDLEELSIGRGEECDVILDDPEVESVHLLLCHLGGGVWRVKVASEGLSMRINSREMEGKKLRNGDRIQVGNSLLQFFELIHLGEEEEEEEEDASFEEEDLAPKEEGLGLEPLAPEEEDLLNHPDLKPPGIYLTHGGILGEFIAIRGHVLIGRGSQCNLVFRDGDVSRTHASLDITPEGKVILTDLASRNGVYVNDKRIEDSCELRGFDLVRLGNTEFIFFENEKNIERFKRLVRRGSILLHRVSVIGTPERKSYSVEDKTVAEHKKSLGSIFTKRRKEEPLKEETVYLLCGNCGEKNDKEAEICAHCGSPLVQKKEAEENEKN